MINIRDLTQEELDEEIIKLGEKKFRAKQIFAWLYRGVDSFDEMTDLSKELIQKLREKFVLKLLEVDSFWYNLLVVYLYIKNIILYSIV